ncbi:MAG: DUF4058 family protein [Gemmatales bacterium]|nr:DUF4058 family protein [Gemmatales bacterium]
MPLHDWARIEPGVYHHFHNTWLAHLSNALNGGILPQGYYALVEQHVGRFVPDLLTLHAATPGRSPHSPPAGKTVLHVAQAPPKARCQVSALATYRRLRRSLAIRHTSGHRLVAVVEITSPANQAHAEAVADLVHKILEFLEHGVHVLLVDILRPAGRLRQGIHSRVWELLAGASFRASGQKPLTLVSYVSAEPVRAYVECVAVGENLPDMPIFLTGEHYVLAPLEETYLQAWAGVPQYWQKRLTKA